MDDLYLDKNLILESNCNFEEARFGILGVPFDSTSTYRPGSRFGPLWIRKEFLELEKSNDFFKIPLFDLGNITTVPGNLQETNKRTEETISSAIQSNSRLIPIILGGEHSISYPAIKSLYERNKGMQVVQFDAHADLKDEYMGERWSHSTVMKRVSELGCPICQIGVRTYDDDEKETAKKILSKNIGSTPAYITIDIDVLNPQIAPGTGTLEPGGLSFEDLLNELKSVVKKTNVIGFDIVEVNPLFDDCDVTSVMAGKLMIELIQEINRSLPQ